MTMLRTMNYKLRTKHGLTLTEMTVVVASIVLLAAIGVPAVRVFIHSFESESGTKNMISAAFASARAMAAQKQRYVGIRFQKAYCPKGPLKADQYMIFIIHDAQIRANGFRAVEGLKPIKLPDSIGIREVAGGPDDTTLSIVFSTSGKLVIHEVRAMNKDGRLDDSSEDDIFNTLAKITHPTNPRGMFVQDGGDRPSQNSFVIYNKTQSEQVQTIYINPYTGTIISQ